LDLVDKVIVVTGAGSGIGRELANRFMHEGAKSVIAVDINVDNAKETADACGCEAMAADVSKEQDIERVIVDTENQFGPIDLFCSNAGLALAPSEQSTTEEWQTSWEVNVMAHVYAARYLVPRMIARGGGYFLNTASAAGLQWLALTYAHQGIKVSLLCPQAVRTAMTTLNDDQLGAEGLAAAAADGMLEVEQVAACVVEGLENESFLILPHPEVHEYMQRKSADYDRWIRGMNRLHCTLTVT